MRPDSYKKFLVSDNLDPGEASSHVDASRRIPFEVMAFAMAGAVQWSAPTALMSATTRVAPPSHFP